MLLAGTLSTVVISVAQKVVPRKAKAARPTLTLILAEQKLGQLRGLTWDVLAPSPQRTLQTDTAGYVDYTDANGVVLGGGEVPPANTAYVRRWAIVPQPSRPHTALIIDVVVLRHQVRSARAAAVEAHLTMVKTRGTRASD